jgi:WD40 repeat protein
MGEVWQAFDLKLQVDVALKALHSAKDESAQARLRREVRAAREVISPHVCRVFDLVEADGRELLSMEYVEGQTLRSLLGKRAPLPVTEARELASQFLSGLEAIHAAGLVHADFKPENIMITPAGRVVVMDLGIARRSKTPSPGSAGTAPYMAPEQRRGGTLDPRTDVFAVGVVLAEMVSGIAARERSGRERLWKAIHQDPPQVSEGPWAPVIRRAVSADPRRRPPSALALSRELGEITLRVEGAEHKRPYPGLAPFTEEEAEHFFGREAEVEVLLRGLRRASLSALVGPSGVGKSSLVGAGLIPALPAGWAHIRCRPGDAPLEALARALAAPGGAPEAVVEAARAWREGHGEAVIVLDQFEELFTLNPPETQSAMADLVGRLLAEADVRVLVAVRDDFLLECQAFPALRPLFQAMIPLGPPTGVALHRALVQPALSLGYRFEDESLVTQMLEEVSRERGALPLLAFAAASLWERRDREEGLLTRRAYEEIGGVAGALARHAEATLARVGVEREPIVRELFRNLVTVEGTRVARDREELLSVFEDRRAAEGVLRQLVDGRLLTAFEVADPNRGATELQRVEVIHESLLSAWPRLLRWRTQDAEGAQLREQLREAARLWEERDRSPDLLWRGTAYREFALWRERYGGGLTSREEEFAVAMVERERRRRRRGGMAAASVVVASLAVAAVVGIARQQEAEARARAEAEARRAEASRLVALGRLELAVDPTVALAFARKSLGMHDTPEARRLAVEALWRGPTARVLPLPSTVSCARVVAAPDGRSLACHPDEETGARSESAAWSIDGRRLVGNPRAPGTESSSPRPVWKGRSLFLRRPGRGPSSDERVGSHPTDIRRATYHEATGAVVSVGEDREVRIWVGPRLDLRHVRQGLDARILSLPGLDRGGTRLVWHSLRERALVMWDLAGPPDAEPLLLRRRDVAGDIGDGVFVGDGDWLVSVGGPAVAFWSVGQPWPRVLRGHASALLEIGFTHDSRHLVSCGGDGARVWPLEPGVGPQRAVVFERAYTCNGVAIGPEGRQVLVAAPTAAGFLAPLDGGETRTLVRVPPTESIRAAAFDPGGRWAAVAGRRLYVADRRTGEVRAHPLPKAEGGSPELGGVYALRALGDRTLVSAGSAGVLRWDVETGAAESLLSGGCGTLDVSADGRRLVVGCLTRERLAEGQQTRSSSVVFVLDLQTGERRIVEGHGDAVQAVALDPSGELMATGDTTGVIRVGRLDGGEPHLLLGASGVVPSVEFSPDGRWVAGAVGSEVWLWPMPDVSRPPLQGLSHDALMAKLDAFTNVYLVEDESTPTGYRAEVHPFPGWETPPTW